MDDDDRVRQIQSSQGSVQARSTPSRAERGSCRSGGVVLNETIERLDPLNYCSTLFGDCVWKQFVRAPGCAVPGRHQLTLGYVVHIAFPF